MAAHGVLHGVIYMYHMEYSIWQPWSWQFTLIAIIMTKWFFISNACGQMKSSNFSILLVSPVNEWLVAANLVSINLEIIAIATAGNINKCYPTDWRKEEGRSQGKWYLATKGCYSYLFCRILYCNLSNGERGEGLASWINRENGVKGSVPIFEW